MENYQTKVSNKNLNFGVKPSLPRPNQITSDNKKKTSNDDVKSYNNYGVSPTPKKESGRPLNFGMSLHQITEGQSVQDANDSSSKTAKLKGM